MQYFRSLMRNKARLGAMILVAAGVLFLAWKWVGPGIWAAGAEPTEPEMAQAAPEEAIVPDEEPTAEPDMVTHVVVYVTGAVRAPDVYELPATARIKDLVLAAGGLTPEADAEAINLAGGLSDGAHIHIPRQDETKPNAGGNESGKGQAEQGALLNLNTASAADLDELDGIGQTLAERIIEYRTANGPFTSIDDLRNVKGIGSALFADIAPLITVGP